MPDNRMSAAEVTTNLSQDGSIHCVAAAAAQAVKKRLFVSEK